MEINALLEKKHPDITDLVYLLNCQGEEEEKLFAYTQTLRNHLLGNGVHMRGLIEISNVCIKDCLYCGIRKSNSNVKRYSLSDQDILSAASYAFEHQYGSIVLQGGERTRYQFYHSDRKTVEKHQAP